MQFEQNHLGYAIQTAVETITTSMVFGALPWEGAMQKSSPSFWNFLTKKVESVSSDYSQTKSESQSDQKYQEYIQNLEKRRLRYLLAYLIAPIYLWRSTEALPTIPTNVAEKLWHQENLRKVAEEKMWVVNPSWMANFFKFLLEEVSELSSDSKRLLYVVVVALLQTIEDAGDATSQKNVNKTPKGKKLHFDPNRKRRFT